MTQRGVGVVYPRPIGVSRYSHRIFGQLPEMVFSDIQYHLVGKPIV